MLVALGNPMTCHIPPSNVYNDRDLVAKTGPLIGLRGGEWGLVTVFIFFLVCGACSYGKSLILKH